MYFFENDSSIAGPRQRAWCKQHFMNIIILRNVTVNNLLLVSKKTGSPLVLLFIYVWVMRLAKLSTRQLVVILVNESICNKNICLQGGLGVGWLWVPPRGFGSWVWCWLFWVVPAEIDQITGHEKMEFQWSWTHPEKL